MVPEAAAVTSRASSLSISTFTFKFRSVSGGCLLRSNFGRSIHTRVPPGCHVLADAGYSARPWLITPYDDSTNDLAERNFNGLHPRARIVVERTFGRFKNRFRIFRKPIADKSTDSMAKTVVACMFLHNYFIAINDEDLPGMFDIDELQGHHIKTKTCLVTMLISLKLASQKEII